MDQALSESVSKSSLSFFFPCGSFNTKQIPKELTFIGLGNRVAVKYIFTHVV